MPTPWANRCRRPTSRLSIPTAKLVADGDVGRLRYRGPAVASRRVDADGIVHELGDGGWYYPGDLAERRPGGYLALRGRDRDIIIRAGINLYPAEIESVLQSHPDIDEAAVIGRSDAARGEVVTAFVAGANLDAGTLGDWCRGQLAPYKIPQAFVVVDALPRAASGKVDRQALLRR